MGWREVLLIGLGWLAVSLALAPLLGRFLGGSTRRSEDDFPAEEPVAPDALEGARTDNHALAPQAADAPPTAVAPRTPG